jgi:hypothetical protein
MGLTEELSENKLKLENLSIDSTTAHEYARCVPDKPKLFECIENAIDTPERTEH